ncbi:MAG: ATP-binding cassette domain-containing protein [Fulvivirga sp.]|uniref:ABC transporter ATP-binding protein n=1 Tax=Fulvivirga sp. TaxID=1931237 RepID=UPI0032F9F589
MNSNTKNISPKPIEAVSTVNEESVPVINIENLRKSFGDNHVLRGFNLKVYPGETVAVLGKSGSGKSVLIKCLVGLLPYDSGMAQVLGKNIGGLTQEELDKLRTDIGFLFQSSALYDSMTVRENLEFSLRRHIDRLNGESINDKVVEVLDSVGLAGTENLMPEELSGGMKKRVALARTLIINPRIIFYDEPTSGLDPITSKEINHLILEIQNKYKTSSIMITHDVQCSRIAANRIVLLVDGVNYVEGRYDELINSPDPEVQAFFK